MMKGLHSGLEHVQRGCLLALAIVLCAAVPALAASLKGTVKNGTTNRPVPGAEVVLMELQRGMVPVAKVKTDAAGCFHFTNPAVGSEPLLLETSYGGVSYYKSVAPGEATATIIVYQSTSEPNAITVVSRAIVFQPNGPKLLVQEQFLVENQTKPPVAYYLNKGTFTFSLPTSAQLGRISTWTATSNMPTLQKPIDSPKNRKAIDWAFRPGKSIIKINYQLPYTSNQATIHTQAAYPVMHLFLAVPPGLTLASDGFNKTGSKDGYDIYARQSVPAETALVISVSGTPSASAASNTGNTATGSAEAGITTLPSRLHNLTWILTACAGVLIALFTILLFRKRSPRPAAENVSGAGDRKQISRIEDSAVHDTDHEEKLERIKDEFLQLEIRHQAGTVGDEDYARERQRVEEALRALVRG
jgi:hypothetical protein